jgi:hypothetical protein
MRFALGLTISCTVSAAMIAAAGAESAGTAMLRGLDPATRFQQACGIEAMKRIRQEAASYRPERAVTDAVSEAKVKGDTMQGDGGAFRSGGKWYQFSFTCKASPDRMSVVFFSYKIGAAIPEGKWESYGLWN